ASGDGTLDALADLPVEAVGLPSNCGFSAGCNVGWRAGASRYVLLLNPDAHIDGDSVRTLVDVLERNARVGLVGPLIVDSDGALDFSQRRFPRVFSTWARALFLHRLAPRASWTDEVVRDPHLYESE